MAVAGPRAEPKGRQGRRNSVLRKKEASPSRGRSRASVKVARARDRVEDKVSDKEEEDSKVSVKAVHEKAVRVKADSKVSRDARKVRVLMADNVRSNRDLRSRVVSKAQSLMAIGRRETGLRDRLHRNRKELKNSPLRH